MRELATIVIGGAAAGALDIGYAFTVHGIRGVSPVTILQSIASGLFGRPAYDGGVATAIVGALLHFGIAWVMAAGFVILSRGVPGLLDHPLRAGATYGLILFCIMNFVVVPLSASPVAFPEGWLLLGAVFAHMALVGIPIAWIAARRLAPYPPPESAL